MKKIKLALIISLVIGVLFISISVAGGLNIPIISDFFNEDEKYGEIKNYYVVSENQEISFDLDDRHVEITYIESGNLYFSYYEHEDDTWSIDEVDGELSVTQERKFNLLKSFSYKFSSRSVRTVKLYVPLHMVTHLFVHTEVGDIDAELGDMIIEQLSLSSSTGDVNVSHFVADTTVVESETGNVKITQITSDTLHARNSTGNITINDSVVETLIKASTSTGNVNVNRSTSSSFDLKTSTGDVNFNNTAYELTIIRYDLVVSVGVIRINGQNQGTRHQTSLGDVIIKAQSSTGKISIITQ